MIDSNIIKDKMDQIQSALMIPLDEDTDISEHLTLGENWDDPFKILEAMDTQPQYYGGWSSMLKTLKLLRTKIQAEFDTWLAVHKEDLHERVYNFNLEKLGMTPNNAKPTGTEIDRKFKTIVSQPSNNEKEKKISVGFKKYTHDLEDADMDIIRVEGIAKAYEQRHGMLISISALVRSMMDNNIYIKAKPEDGDRDF